MGRRVLLWVTADHQELPEAGTSRHGPFEKQQEAGDEVNETPFLRVPSQLLAKMVHRWQSGELACWLGTVLVLCWNCVHGIPTNAELLLVCGILLLCLSWINAIVRAILDRFWCRFDAFYVLSCFHIVFMSF